MTVAVSAELVELRSAAEAIRGAETTARIEAEIDNLGGFRDAAQALLPGAESRLNRAEATMADLCNPDPFCDPFPDAGTTTPLLGWVLGLAALLGGGYLASRRFGNEPDAEPEVDQKAKTKAAAK